MSESARRSRASSSERRWPSPAKSSYFSEVEFLQSPSNLPSNKLIAILHEHILWQSKKCCVSECRVTVPQGSGSQITTGGGGMCCKACSAVQTETMQC